MFQQRLPRPNEGAELQRRRAGLDEERRLLEDVLPRGSDGGPVVDPGRAAEAVFVTLHGIVSTTVSGRLWGPAVGREDAQAASEALVDFAVDGWMAAWGLAG